MDLLSPISSEVFSFPARAYVTHTESWRAIETKETTTEICDVLMKMHHIRVAGAMGSEVSIRTHFEMDGGFTGDFAIICVRRHKRMWNFKSRLVATKPTFG